MKTKTFRNLEELKPYYIEEINTYNFTDFDLVIFEFDLNVESNISALNIEAKNIKTWNIDAYDIDAENIVAWDINACVIKAIDIYANDIKAFDINANDISYYAFCIAYQNIKCSSIKGERENCKHFALDGKVKVIKE